MRMTGAEVLVNCLIEQDVDTVFGFPGGAVLFIYDALYEYQDKISHILTCHEQHAAHAADGYARSTGKTGVVIATSGPGASNLVTGIATAYMDSVPMVAITGNVSLGLLGKDSFQEIDIAGVTMPITKHNFIVKDVNDLADIVRQAFEIANTGRPGPVLIDIPKDITSAEVDYEPKKPKKIERQTKTITKDAVEKTAELINAAQKPLIYAGGGVIASDAAKELKAFAEKIGAPVTLSLMGIGAYPATDPNYTGMVGMHGTMTSSLAVTECDLLIAIGARFSDRVICKASTFAKNAKIVHIDIDPAEIGKNVPVVQSVIGDVKEVLKRLDKEVKKNDRKEWLAQIAEWKKQYPIDMDDEHCLMPQYIIETAWDMIKDNGVVTTEVGQHQMWVGQYLKAEKPRTLVTSGGLGTMGFGLGAAIGSQIGNPDKRVVNIAGDGSFHMNLAELATAVTYELPIIEIIMNNNVLGMVRQWQKMFYDKRYSHTTLDRKTDYKKLAEAFGALGFVVEKREEFAPAMQAALASGKPCVIDCRIGCDVNVLPMVPSGAPIEAPILELD
ncbi:MAG: biosynthetic-type acetolactate synthase large subunit [Anaerofustis sp.]